MDLENYLRFLAALVLVIGLIGTVAWVARRFGLAGRLPSLKRRGERRLGVIEYMALDPKTRLVLVRRDDTQHLLLLGAAGPVVVERGIAEPAPPETALKTETTTETTNIEAAE